MAIDLKKVQQWLSGVLAVPLRKNVPAPQGGPAPYVPEPPQPSSSAAQPAASMIGLEDDPEFKQYRKQYDDAQAVLAEPRPGAVEPEVDPAEAILSAFVGSRISNPAALGRTLGAPWELASGRANRQNAALGKTFDDRRESAKISLDSAEKMIGALYERDAVTAKIAAEADRARLDREAKIGIANAKNDIGLIREFAKLHGENKLTVDTAAMILLELGKAQDLESASRMAAGILDELPGNVAFRQEVERGKLALGQQKLDAERVQADFDMIGKDAPETGLPMKLAAIQRLQASGRLPPGDPMAIAQQVTDEQLSIRARTSLADAQRRLTDEKKKYLPATVAVNVAKGLAMIDHLRNQDQLAFEKFDFEQQKVIRNQQIEVFKATLGQLKSAYGHAADGLQSLRVNLRYAEAALADHIAEGGSLSDDEGKRLGERADNIRAAIRGAREQLAKIHEEADSLRSKAEEGGISATEIDPPQESALPTIDLPPDAFDGGGNVPVVPGGPSLRGNVDSGAGRRGGSGKPKSKTPPKPGGKKPYKDANGIWRFPK